MSDIEFYCGLNEKRWNYHAVEPGPRVCVAPVTSVTLKDKDTDVKRRVLRKTQVLIDETKVNYVLLDSGAFSDGIEIADGRVVRNNRLSFDHAFQRQVAHAYEFRYAHLVEGIVSYDLLIDEVWQDGERSKNRWAVESAEFAVTETINAAKWLSSRRQRIDNVFNHHVRLVLSAQGVNAEQYRRCTEEIVAVMEHDDIFGLGGWCITGLRRHEMLPFAAQCLPGVFAVLGQAGVTRVHVFGVIIPQLLGFLLHLCDMYGIRLSTDSAGPCVEPACNGNWGYGSWTNPDYKVAPVLDSCKDGATCNPDTFCRGLERIKHTHLTREYLADFRNREPALIRSIKAATHHQLSWLELAS